MVVLAAGLTACDDQAASYRATATGETLTLIRHKPYPWSASYDLAVVVARLPECQRRHRLQPMAVRGAATVDVLRGAEAGLVLREGSRYYLIDTATCDTVRLPSGSAPEASVPLGSFDTRGGRFVFTPAPRQG